MHGLFYCVQSLAKDRNFKIHRHYLCHHSRRVLPKRRLASLHDPAPARKGRQRIQVRVIVTVLSIVTDIEIVTIVITRVIVIVTLVMIIVIIIISIVMVMEKSMIPPYFTLDTW